MITEQFQIRNKTALVTGASRGLGKAMAIALAQAGADVCCASTSLQGTDKTAAAVHAAGQRAWQVSADFSDQNALQEMVQNVEAQAGHIDILVNNAGTIRRHPAAEHPMEDWQLVLKVNLDAAFVLSKHFGQQMIARGYGKIINIASLLSFTGGITVPGYTASKHAIAGLTKALANEWAGHGVQVNAIAPGYFRTDNTQPLQDNPERANAISGRIPAGRWGEPADLAGAVVFLAAPASNYVNGHVLVVDGGWTAR